jgi:hypothetical protein
MPVEATEVDVVSLERLLVRIAPQLAPADYALIEKLVRTLLGLLRQVREHGTTIARLRRFIGMSGSEKTRAVLGRKQGEDELAPEGANPAAADGGGDPSAGEAGTPEPEPPPPKPPLPRPGRKERTCKGHGRLGVSAYPHACHVPVAHESLRPGDACPLCGGGTLFELDPAHWLRIVGDGPLSAKCSCLQRLRCCPCGAVFTAKAPPEAQGGKIAPSAVAMVAQLHYLGGMPHHRLERIQEDLETPLPASSQSEAVAAGEEDIRPVHEELKRQAAQGTVMYLDDTRGPVLEFMGKRRAALVESGELPNPERSGLFTSGLVSMDALERKIALFMTGRQHAGENLADLLSLRAAGLPPPILMSDALSWNAPQGHVFIESHCIPHARRYWVDEVVNHPQECAYVLEKLELVFKVDALSRQHRLTPEQRLRLHQRQSGPVMDELEAWMRAQFEQKRVEPNSGLGRAINYMLKRWTTFTVFLRVPGAPLENNTAERTLKAAIRHRRNSLFYRSSRGARIGDCYMSLLYTAELNGENSLAYLTALLNHPAAVARNPKDWMPWTYRATLARMGEGDRAGPHQASPPIPSAAAAERTAA